MSKADANIRQLLIIRKLIDGNASFENIIDFLIRETKQSEKFQISTRTFRRDIEDIRTIFGIDIQYDFHSRVYYINPKAQSPFTKRFLKAFELYKVSSEEDKSERYGNHNHFEKAEEVELSFKPNISHSVKICPLHESQEIIADSEKEFSVRLNLKITSDFVIELLSFGEQVKVLKPEKLSQEVQRIYQEALEQYYL